MLYACFASEGGIVHCHWPTRETLHTCQGNRWASIFAKSFKPPLRFGAYYLDPGLNVAQSKSTKANTCFLNSNPHFFLQHFVGNRLQSRLGLSNLGRDQAQAPQTDSSSSSLIAICGFHLVPSPWVPIQRQKHPKERNFWHHFNLAQILTSSHCILSVVGIVSISKLKRQALWRPFPLCLSLSERRHQNSGHWCSLWWKFIKSKMFAATLMFAVPCISKRSKPSNRTNGTCETYQKKSSDPPKYSSPDHLSGAVHYILHNASLHGMKFSKASTSLKELVLQSGWRPLYC